MLWFRRPSQATLDKSRRLHEEDAFTYSYVGATRQGMEPAGVHVLRRRVRLGEATDGTFERAVAGARSWQIQLGAGLFLSVPGDVQEGAVIVQAAPLPFAGFVQATCRVVYVDDEPDLFAFAYGTLADHPESGEERFAVVREDNDVYFELLAYSRPQGLLAHLAGPLAWRIQRRVTDRYLDAIARATKP